MAESVTTKQMKPESRFSKRKGTETKHAYQPKFYDALQNRQSLGDSSNLVIQHFVKAVERADLNLPDGQLSHVLRHTFASHFMMNGGNILVLKSILEHTKDIKMT